jgi:hypothetical protein
MALFSFLDRVLFEYCRKFALTKSTFFTCVFCQDKMVLDKSGLLHQFYDVARQYLHLDHKKKNTEIARIVIDAICAASGLMAPKMELFGDTPSIVTASCNDCDECKRIFLMGMSLSTIFMELMNRQEEFGIEIKYTNKSL